ncbi:ATP-binding protein [Paraliobacillus zengyii]|uniref:ATP-binding protein n=1 Tax=Paraliobacillus zengyii TaxID=2213194 RepID=UPI000E3BDFB7|nr:ATP-binding protein [Paraliobacillus zengyii]
MYIRKVNLKSTQVKGDIVAGNKYGLDEEMMEDLIQDMLSNATSPNQHKLSDEEYKKLAEDLLKSFSPHSLLSLYPDVSKETDAAISSIDWESRRLVNINQQDRELDPSITKITELLSLQHKKHLIIGAGGLGKTHTLWRMANKLLATGQAFPIYLSLADFNSISEVIAFLDDMIPNDGGLTQLKQHPNVTFFLDGWSQFPKGLPHVPDSERQKLLAILGDSRVIATGRYTTPFDSPFTIWELEGLSDSVVKAALSIGLPNVNYHQTEQINELLRFPLC